MGEKLVMNYSPGSLMKMKVRLYRLLTFAEDALRLVTGRDSKIPSCPISPIIKIGGEKFVVRNNVRSLLVYASTMGEFNAIKPVIKAYSKYWPDDQLVILTSHEQYIQAIHLSYPDAAVGIFLKRLPCQVRPFLQLVKPRAAIFSEGPSLHCRFPQRLDLPFCAECILLKIPIFVANACLYEHHFHSRIERLENWLFGNIHTQAIHHWFTSYQSFKAELIEANVPSSRISVVGDLKFDSLEESGIPPSSSVAAYLAKLRVGNAPIIVGGSVNALDDQKSLVEAWERVKKQHPLARLIIAPRYVNNPEIIAGLRNFLTERGHTVYFRSMGEVQETPDITILDVFGELPHFYSIADLCYIGRNHGLLEPLRYGKVIVVANDWRKDYAAYKQYTFMVNEKAIVHLEDKSQLGDIMLDLLGNPILRNEYIFRGLQLVRQQRGVGERTIAAIQKLIGQGSEDVPAERI